MTTQYGFFIDSSRCTGCKTCELACKDYKDLTPDVSFRRIYEYAGGDWQITASGTRTSLPIISPFRATTAKTRPVPKSARAARCTSAMTVLWW
ncbi:dimethyl sulfoxide reductase [Salmonella enterica]|nr:dimethyl sulfoxide reductase [Salmonella enterica]